MLEYHTALRGAFFDISQPAASADDIARYARYIDDGVLFIYAGKIQALLPWQEGEALLDPHKGYRDLRGKLLLPGFVDAHIHYPQTEMIGAFGEQLLEWLTTYTFPVESQFADERYAADIARFFCQPVAQPWHHHRAGVLYASSCVRGGPVYRGVAPEHAPAGR